MSTAVIDVLAKSAETAHELIQQLRDARTRELELIADLSDEQMIGPTMRIVEPPIWEMGHVGWFQEYWVLRNLYGADPLRSDADSLYDSFDVANAERWHLGFPSRKETRDYINSVLEHSVQKLESREPTKEEIYYYHLSIYHEDMHSETLHHIRQTLGYARPTLSGVQHNKPAVTIDSDFEPHDVEIPGGTFMLGATEDIPFVWDNEKWAHPVEVAPFRISATPVTHAEYQAFVEAGGYKMRELWSDEGWAWHEQSGSEHPVFWQRGSDDAWQWRRFDTLVPLEAYAPMMHVNWFEANAYCAWAARRLPSEAEWEMAASAEPTPDGRGITQRKCRFPWGDEPPSPEKANLDSAVMGCVDVRALSDGDSAFGCRQMIGNVWEWTADTFDAYPGFVLQPYKEYSEPSFGQQKVLRGGCWTTRSRLIRNTFRNFYTPDRNNIFAGFRTCAK